MQVTAYVAFKYGSFGRTGRSRRWLTGFVGGNVVGASSIYFLMKIYEAMPGNCNVALVLAGGGSFIGTQTVLALVFRSRLSAMQWTGVAMVGIGSAVATLAGPGVGP
jgi:multidrug transporter EmrE-like cation transporter